MYIFYVKTTLEPNTQKRMDLLIFWFLDQKEIFGIILCQRFFK